MVTDKLMVATKAILDHTEKVKGPAILIFRKIKIIGAT
jgi:hypothetical protein